jgi:lipopolysaccharide transport system ATP-binding protein
MTQAEIRKKFDEIVAFAEVEKFLDAPVKRYSSGMYVRLVFAVAAHLEPEILVLDEVLAVGDAEFQKKCLGKMRDVSLGGRTVLFVSHNMAAVKSLTSRSVVLRAGRLHFNGGTEEAIETYIDANSEQNSGGAIPGIAGSGGHTRIQSAVLLDDRDTPTSSYRPGASLRLQIEFETDGTKGLSLDLFLVDHMRSRVRMGSLSHFSGRTLSAQAGLYRTILEIAPLYLAAGQYSVDVVTAIVNHSWDHHAADALQFDVPFSNPFGGALNFQQSYGYGSLALPFIDDVIFESQQTGGPRRAFARQACPAKLTGEM